MLRVARGVKPPQQSGCRKAANEDAQKSSRLATGLAKPRSSLGNLKSHGGSAYEGCIPKPYIH